MNAHVTFSKEEKKGVRVSFNVLQTSAYDRVAGLKCLTQILHIFPLYIYKGCE